MLWQSTTFQASTVCTWPLLIRNVSNVYYSVTSEAAFRMDDGVYNPNDFTLQELCAKEGGKPSIQNLNAICTADSDQVWFNGPRFDYELYRELSPVNGGYWTGNQGFRQRIQPLETVRLQAYCLQNCVCSRLVVNSIAPPRRWGPPGAQGILLPNEPTQLPYQDPVGVPLLAVIKLQDLKWTPVNTRIENPSMRIGYKHRRLLWRSDGGLPGPDVRKWELSFFTIDRRNSIICGQQPDVDFVLPYQLPEYVDLLSIKD